MSDIIKHNTLDLGRQLQLHAWLTHADRPANYLQDTADAVVAAAASAELPFSVVASNIAGQRKALGIVKVRGGPRPGGGYGKKYARLDARLDGLDKTIDILNETVRTLCARLSRMEHLPHNNTLHLHHKA